jgi:hypothetical protein
MGARTDAEVVLSPRVQEVVMSQYTQLSVPSETQLWVSWVIALAAIVGLVAATVVVLVLVFG